MRKWNLHSGDPLSLFLAADARFGAPDYADDQIWELSLGGGNPPALAVETMLGLRAICLRLFPVFFMENHPIFDPRDFASPPVVRRFAPNYLQVDFQVVGGLEAVCEYWVPESHALSGRITLMGTGSAIVRGECWLAGLLRPAADGSPFTVESAGPYGGAYLRGKAGNIHPVVAMAGVSGVGRSAHPSLKAAFEAGPDRTRQIRWAHCGLSSPEEGLRLARSLISRPWEADIARVDLENASLVDISTGEEEWDAVLAFSQVSAVQSLIGPTLHLPYSSPIVGRNPERGYSLRGDGSDYPPAWAGSSPWELLPAISVLALAKPEMAKDVLRNFLAAAGAGLPDARPGAGKQRANMLCPPILAQLAGRVLSGKEDLEFLRELRPPVERCLEAWFDPAHDRDQDGAPEWERMDSLGPETPPLFARGEPGGGAVPPAEVETPSLVGLLYGECCAAARMAALCGQPPAAEKWRARAEEIRRALQRMTTGEGYRTVDRETHSSSRGRILWEGTAGEEGRADPLAAPARIQIRCFGSMETRPIVRVALRGKDSRNRPCEEEVRSEHFSWIRGAGVCFSRSVWKEIDSIRTEGPPAGTIFRLEIPDLRREDLSNFLPLWSRAAPPELAEKMFARLSDPTQYDSPLGLRFVPAGDPAAAGDSGSDLWMTWMMLMGEAAIRYGKGELAYRWMEKAIRAAANELRAGRAFRSSHRPQRPGGTGPRNSVLGIFPLGLFLAGLGVYPLSARRAWVGGRSIFPFAVTLRFKGTTIRREGDSTEIEFPSGEKRSLRGTERQLVEGAKGR